METIRVLVCDSQAIFREGIRSILAGEPDFEIVGETGDGLQALELVDRLQPDIVIADTRLPSLDGFELTKKVRMAARSTAFILLSGSGDDEEMLFQAIRAGAAAFFFFFTFGVVASTLIGGSVP